MIPWPLFGIARLIIVIGMVIFWRKTMRIPREMHEADDRINARLMLLRARIDLNEKIIAEIIEHIKSTNQAQTDDNTP